MTTPARKPLFAGLDAVAAPAPARKPIDTAALAEVATAHDFARRPVVQATADEPAVTPAVRATAPAPSAAFERPRLRKTSDRHLQLNARVNLETLQRLQRLVEETNLAAGQILQDALLALEEKRARQRR